MKVVIVGQSLFGLLSTLKFLELGADVTLISKKGLSCSLESVSTSALSELYQWKRELRLKLEAYCELNVIEAEVLSVAYSHLSLGEVLREPGKLPDSLTVIYRREASEIPGAGQSLPRELGLKLKEPHNSYIIADIVVDACGIGEASMPMGSGYSLAVNERTKSVRPHCYYALEAFSVLKQIHQFNKIMLVGKNLETMLFFNQLESWLKIEGHMCTIVTPETSLFQDVLAHSYQSVWANAIIQNYQRIAQELRLVEEEKLNSYQFELAKWEKLESYLQAKMARPMLAPPQVLVLYAQDVISLDKLMDQEDLYVTTQRSSLHYPKDLDPQVKQSIEQMRDMLTTPQQAIFVLRGGPDFAFAQQFINYTHQQMERFPGFFALKKQLAAYDDVEQKVGEMVDRACSYFRRV